MEQMSKRADNGLKDARGLKPKQRNFPASAQTASINEKNEKTTRDKDGRERKKWKYTTRQQRERGKEEEEASQQAYTARMLAIVTGNGKIFIGLVADCQTAKTERKSESQRNIQKIIEVEENQGKR